MKLLLLDMPLKMLPVYAMETCTGYLSLFIAMVQTDLALTQQMLVVFVLPCTGMSNSNKSNFT